MKSAFKIDPLVLAQKCFALIDTTKKSGTYKYATLLALLNLVERNVDERGYPPKKISVSDIGREVMRLYWDQAKIFIWDKRNKPKKNNRVLSQSPPGASGDSIVVKIANYRNTYNSNSQSITMDSALRKDPNGFRGLKKDIIKIVADKPIRLLQKFGEGSESREELFLYDFSWKGDLTKRQIATAHLILKPGVGKGLLLLSPLLRTQIENEWMKYVSDQNKFDAKALNDYLFGFMRSVVSKFAKYLVPLQGGKCFYCGTGIKKGKAHVDHVIPWSFSHDDGIYNLVATCKECNENKTDMLLGLRHLRNWSKRLKVGSPENLAITKLAAKHKLFPDLDLTRKLARSAYVRAVPGTSVWNSYKKIGTIDKSASLKILA